MPSPARFAVVPAASGYLLRGTGTATEVLLQLRRRTGYMDGHWAAAAAGHLERGETAYAAAHREAAEELGLESLELRFVTSMHRTAHAEPIDERIDFFFTARTWVGEPRPLEPDKCAEVRWCRLAALPRPTVPHERILLELLAGGEPVPPYLTYGF